MSWPFGRRQPELHEYLIYILDMCFSELEDIIKHERDASYRPSPCAIVGLYLFSREKLYELGVSTEHHDNKFDEYVIKLRTMYNENLQETLKEFLTILDQKLSRLERSLEGYKIDLENNNITANDPSEFDHDIIFARDDIEYFIRGFKVLYHNKDIVELKRINEKRMKKIDEKLKEFLPKAIKAYVLEGYSFPKKERVPDIFWWWKILYEVTQKYSRNDTENIIR